MHTKLETLKTIIPCIFEEGPEREAALRMRTGTMITEWFEANKKHACARHLRYLYFPQYYTWNKYKKDWMARASMCVRQADVNNSSRGTEQQNNDFTRAGVHVASML